jgi:hypothetical protein
VERGKRKKAQLKRAYVRIRVTKEGQLGMFAGTLERMDNYIIFSIPTCPYDEWER